MRDDVRQMLVAKVKRQYGITITNFAKIEEICYYESVRNNLSYADYRELCRFVGNDLGIQEATV